MSYSWSRICPFRHRITTTFVSRRNVKIEVTPARYEIIKKVEKEEYGAKTVLFTETCVLLLNVIGCVLLVCIFGLGDDTDLASKISSVIRLRNPAQHETFTKHFNIVAGLVGIFGNLLNLGLIILLIQGIKECNWTKRIAWNFAKLVIFTSFLIAAIWIVTNAVVFHWYFAGVLVVAGYYRLTCFYLINNYIKAIRKAEASVTTTVVA